MVVVYLLLVALLSIIEKLTSEIFGPLSVMHSMGSTTTPACRANALIKEGKVSE